MVESLGVIVVESMDPMKRHAVVLRACTGVGKTTVRREVERLLNDDGTTVVLDHGWGEREKRGAAKNPFECYSDLLGRPENMMLVELGWGETATTRPKDWIGLLQADGRHVIVFQLEGASRERPGVQVEDHKAKLAKVDFDNRSGLRQVVLNTEGRGAVDLAREILDYDCPHCR